MGRKLFLSLLFCSLGVLNIQQAGNRSAGQVSVGREGRGRVGQAAWERPGVRPRVHLFIQQTHVHHLLKQQTSQNLCLLKSSSLSS